MATYSRFEGKEISSAYSKFRPVYPRKVETTIITYMRSEGSLNFNTVLDVACGSGQGTFLLCNTFQNVIGLDISQMQIEQAEQKRKNQGMENVMFMVGDAHNLPIESSSVDLLTCATAWHWLDSAAFYAEAKRVLKPRGCVAVYGHGVRVEDNRRIRNAFDKFDEELFQYDCFAEQNLHVLNNYASVSLPFLNTQRIELDFSQEASIDMLLGFFSSVSMYKVYSEKYPENMLMQKIRANYEKEDGKHDVEKFTFPGFVIMGLNE